MASEDAPPKALEPRNDSRWRYRAVRNQKVDQGSVLFHCWKWLSSSETSHTEELTAAVARFHRQTIMPPFL